MSLKYGFLSFLAFCVCLFGFSKNYELWTHPLNQIPDDVVEKKSEGKQEASPVMEVRIDPSSMRARIIAEKNIFSPERKDFRIVSVEQSKTNVRPQVVLYGITITGDYQAASIISSGRPLRKGERETLTLKIGEQIGGYKLAKILPDRIAMESNGDTFEVLLYDSKKPKKQMEARAETKPEMTASAQSAPVPPSGEAPTLAPPQESVKEPKAPAQTQGVTPPPLTLPFNKYTYQLLGPAAAIGRGRIYNPPPGPGHSGQESVRK